MKLKIFFGLLIAFAMALGHEAEAQKPKEIENLKQIIELQDYAIQLCYAKYDTLMGSYIELDVLTKSNNLEILAIVDNIKSQAKEAESALIEEAKRKEIECKKSIDDVKAEAKEAESVYISIQKRQARKCRRQKTGVGVAAFGVGILSGFIIQ